jgi:two-component system cell cycle sensor histidine kinase/response regulator CckA
VPGGSSEEWLFLKFTLTDRTGEKFIGGVGVDVTERNRLESELRQSQKLEAIGQLAGGVAHDFNNILAVIIGYSEAGLDRARAGAEVREDLSEIITAANRGTELIKQLLAFSRKEVSWPRVVDLNSALIDIDKILHRLCGEDICLTLLLGQDIGSVKIDPGQIEQIVINLVVNARDAMPNGGQLLVETRNTHVTETEAEQYGVVPGDYVTVEVGDTGTGMNAETAARIFEPFFTTKESGRGTGLGLSTCYGIAKQNGGFITVDSTPGKGSTFQVSFPRVQAVAPSVAAPEPEKLPEGEESVLLVEDDEPLREVTADALRGLGYEVIEANDGEYARRLLKSQDASRIDLVLTDVGMPRLDGASLAKWMAEEKPHVKILFVSGYNTNTKFNGAEFSNSCKFLPKPFTRKQLAFSVREALDHNNAVVAG